MSSWTSKTELNFGLRAVVATTPAHLAPMTQPTAEPTYPPPQQQSEAALPVPFRSSMDVEQLHPHAHNPATMSSTHQ
eukprot:5782720-Amphidinium_carterae.1